MPLIPLVTTRGQNNREHHMARARRVKREREAVSWGLFNCPRPLLPCDVYLTRIAPSSGLDDDNLSGSLKSVRDAVADWLGIDDGECLARWHYGQVRGPWGVHIAFSKPPGWRDDK